MSNLKSLKTNHYLSKILNTKKFTLKTNSGNIQKYIGFKINDLLILNNRTFIINKNKLSKFRCINFNLVRNKFLIKYY